MNFQEKLYFKKPFTFTESHLNKQNIELLLTEERWITLGEEKKKRERAVGVFKCIKKLRNILRGIYYQNIKVNLLIPIMG